MKYCSRSDSDKIEKCYRFFFFVCRSFLHYALSLLFVYEFISPSLFAAQNMPLKYTKNYFYFFMMRPNEARPCREDCIAFLESFVITDKFLFLQLSVLVGNCILSLCKLFHSGRACMKGEHVCVLRRVGAQTVDDNAKWTDLQDFWIGFWIQIAQLKRITCGPQALSSSTESMQLVAIIIK